MYLLLLLAYATELTTALGPSSICSRGINGLLQPLATHAPAQSFCSKKYPTSAVTVTAACVAQRAAPAVTTTAPPNPVAKADNNAV